MKNLLKWLSIVIIVLLVTIIAAVLIIPALIDVNKYKPAIEQKVTEATGREFTFGDEIDISVFPWIGIKLTDLHFANPLDYKKKDMISVKVFEVRLKVMPLLSKQIEIKTFVLDSPKIYLEKQKNGTANWEGIGSKDKKIKDKDMEKKSENSSKDTGLPIEDLKVSNFSITNGQLIYVDKETNTKKEISDLNLNLANISLENPVEISFSAKLDGKPISLEGTAGPIGKEVGKGTIAIDFVLKALDTLEIKLNGNIVDPMISQTIDLKLDVASFSLKKLLSALGQSLPVQPKDSKVLEAIAIKTRIKGNKNSISFSDGLLLLDTSKLMFSASAKEFDKPNLKFDLQLDDIDLDRYLPEPVAKDEPANKEDTPEKKDSAKKKTDYDPLRKLVLDGKVKVGKLKAHGAKVENINVHIVAKNGIITMDPLGLDLYKGSVASKLEVNVQKNNPKTKIIINADNIQTGPLMQDTVQKELIEGTLKTNILLSMTGESDEMIKKTLTGKGELLFIDGAIVGFDIANSVRNVKAKLSGTEKVRKKPRTDFAELKVPFTSKNGLVNTIGASLVSPLIRVLVTGDINLMKELLDLKIDPKFVATLKGQGDTKKRSGIMVPVLVTGSFAAPKIRPDLKGMLTEGTIPLDADVIQKQILGTQEGTDTESIKKELESEIQTLIPGFAN